MATQDNGADQMPASADRIFSIPELPTGRYRDEGFYELEIEHVWRKSWLFAGHVSELPDTGSFKLFEELGGSVVISRDGDVIRAFHNTCRHRGAEILQKPKGTAKRFVCPYHSWGYDLSGKLVSVPEIEDFPCLKKEEKSLLPVRCEIYRGFIYINLDKNAASLAEHMEPVADAYADIPFENLVPKFELTYDVVGNWKAVYDNFLEGYHVSTVHARTVGNQLDNKGSKTLRYRHGHGRLITKLRRPNAPLLNGEMDEAARISDRFDQSIEGLMPFPNGNFVIDSVSVSVLHFWPVGKDNTRIRTVFYALKGSSQEHDQAYWDSFMAYQNEILEEDRVLLPGIQRNINNGTSPTMVLKNGEQIIHNYHQEIDRLIGQERIDPELRVKVSLPIDN